MTEPLIFEHLTRVAPLGLRFWDSASGQFISDGLFVQAVPKLPSGVYLGAPVQANANRSGVFVFNHMPGLQVSEFGSGDQEYWQTPPAKKDYTITVLDTLFRFLPFTFDVQAPAKKILAFACSNGKPTPLPDKQPSGSIPLYSAPGRSVPGGCAVIRASLARNPLNPLPAAWAVVEAYVEGALVCRGLSDAKGQLALYFPYPKFVLPNPMSNRPPLTQATWPVDILVFSSLSPPSSSPQNLCTLYAQPAANPLRQVSPDLPLQKQNLAYGLELVIQTQDKSELFIS